MAFVNVNRETSDQFYRYKMPCLIAKVEGKGNGIKTVIVNMTEIAKALNRPPSYTCKFFGCELGAQTQIDHKNARYIVNGAHEGPKLQDLLDIFIKKFVLCPECENPETDLNVQVARNRITQSCKACGYHGLIDTRHKLTTYIFKNPPNGDEPSSGKKDKKGRRQDKKAKGKKEDNPGGGAGDHPPSPTNNGHTADEEFDTPPVVNGRDDGDWSMDTSKEAVKARMEDLSEGVTALALTDDLEKSSAQRMELFDKFVEGVKNKGGVPGIAAALTKIKSEAERLEVFDKAVVFVAEHLYTERMLSEIKEYRPIILHFVLNNKKAQKYLLGSFEVLVGETHPELLPKVPHILKAFYDQDILEEEVILEWAEKVSKKYVNKKMSTSIHEKAAPFIEWLKTAEEETSDEEEEGDGGDLEVVYSKQATGASVKVEPAEQPSSAPLSPSAPKPGEDQDIDIDAI